MKLKKSLGQHFLRDKNILQKIVSFLPDHDGSVIIEIGAGAGTLTEILLERFPNVIAVEIDHTWAQHLKEKFQSRQNFRLIHDDFLKIDLASLISPDQHIWLVGNIPYNITSQIMFKMIEHRQLVRHALLLMQKEVAQRITAHEGNKDFGILSIATQIFFSAAILYHIPPSAFIPPPKVDSSLVQFNRIDQPMVSDVEWPSFLSFIHTLFSNRRKMIRNNLKKIVNLNADVNLRIASEYLTKRVEQLSLKEIYMLFNQVREVMQS